MATLTIRNVGRGTHDRLRERAAREGRSVEAEVRAILATAVDAPRHNLLVDLVDRLDGRGVDLEIDSRTDASREVELPWSWPTPTSSASSCGHR